MRNRKKIINNLSRIPKVNYLIFIFVIIFALSVAIPTLARFQNRAIDTNIAVWDGSVASSYRSGSGTKDDPYVIASGSELAYFANMLESNDYSDTYFSLDNNIILNGGVFAYLEDSGIQYIVDGNTYYVNDYTSDYYTLPHGSGDKVGTLNIIKALNNFKGTLDGNSYTISGLYINSTDSEELGLFNNLEGTINNLYLTNSVVNGGYTTGLLAVNSNNANINNVVVDGLIVGNSSEFIKTVSTSLGDKTLKADNNTVKDTISLLYDESKINGPIKAVALKGTVSKENVDGTLSINGIEVVDENFEVFLGTSLVDETEVSFTGTGTGEVKLTNLSYEIRYIYNTTSLIANANNTTLKNVINKADIYGVDNSAGLIGNATNVNISQAYNTGLIKSNNSAGLIAKLTNSNNKVVISKVYNSGELIGNNNAGLINTITDSNNVIIENSFNAIESEYTINSVENSSVDINTSYHISGTSVNSGTTDGDFVETSLINLKTKNYVINTFGFNEFVDPEDLKENPENIWVYDSELPILAIDDINNPIANIHVGSYTWDNVGYELSTVKFGTEVAFSIEEANSFRPLKEIYYYISNSKEPLMKDEIEAISDWKKYENIVTLSNEGFYTIYVKVVDYDNQEYYLNTDLIVVDLSKATTSIKYQNKTWDKLNEELSDFYVTKNTYFTVEATDDLSGVKSIEYYVTDQVLNEEALNGITDWQAYQDKITVDSKGKNIVYVKVTDECDYVTYVNTDYIIYDGYSINGIYPGRNKKDKLDNLNITSNSSLTLNVTYKNDNEYKEGYNHNLITNTLLPVNTKILLVDKKDNKVYSYKIETSEDIYNYNDSCKENDDTCEKVATYPFELFSIIGKATMTENFDETKFSGKIDEEFDIVFDFSEVELSEDLKDIKPYIEIRDKDNNIVRSTLDETIKSFSLYAQNAFSTLSIDSSYNGNAINYNSDSTTEVNVTLNLDKKQIDGKDIYDTTFENKTFGFMIRLVDKDGKMLEQEYLKNLKFVVDEQTYYSDTDGFVRIPLNDNSESISKNIIIMTSTDNTKLKDGDYTLKISGYAAYDGTYSNEFSVDEVDIPVVVENGAKENYSFDVLMDDNSKIITKKDNENKIELDIIKKANLSEANVRVSLYTKKELTAYNQEYTSVLMNNYFNNNLELALGNTYYLIKNPKDYDGTNNTYNHVTLDLNLDKFNYGGYKLVFDLYDKDKKIGTVEKKFIVK